MSTTIAIRDITLAVRKFLRKPAESQKLQTSPAERRVVLLRPQIMATEVVRLPPMLKVRNFLRLRSDARRPDSVSC